MLNRHSLRIKAFQRIYAYAQTLSANAERAADLTSTYFEKDMLSMAPYDTVREDARARMAALLFQEMLATGTYEASEDTQINTAAEGVFGYYNTQKAADFDRIKRGMLQEATDINHLFLALVMLLPAITFQIEMFEDEQANLLLKPNPSQPHQLKYLNNPIIAAILEDVDLKAEVARHSANIWEETDNADFVRQFFRQVLLPSESYTTYANLPEATREQHLQICTYIIKNLAIKHPIAKEFFEEYNLQWEENAEIVKSMALRTIKPLIDKGTPALLVSLSADWEDDKLFFEQLYIYAANNLDTYQALIAERSENWEANRIAVTDRVILTMAMAEMQYFSSIPIKVTINEYLEVAKVYSTPQSKSFINGLLDTLAEDMGKMGMIKKSGRGLIED